MNIPQAYFDTCKLYEDNAYNNLGEYPERYREIAKFLYGLTPTPTNILEVGCLTGYGMNILWDEGFTVQGVEIYSKALENAVNKKIIKASADKLPFPDGHFDAVISLGVLEHIHRDGVPFVLKEMSRVSAVNVHRIHMLGFNHAYGGEWHITVERPSWWWNEIERCGVPLEGWYITHEP